MPPRKDRVKPTHYPVIPFHILRTAQLVSSIIVASIMSYFIKELKEDNYGIPWTFILLLTVSLLTLLSLTATIALHCFYGLNPLLNLALNTSLFILWVVSFALLSWWTSGTLSHVCNRKNWDDDMGIAVCRVYKALFSFALFGVFSTLLALILDIHVRRRSTVRGKFTALQNLDNKRAFDAPGNVLALDDHEAAESNPNPSARGQQSRQGTEGYAVPDEQFVYHEDMGYSGAGGQVGRRSVEDRI